MALKDTVATSLATDVGRLRTNNEDALAEDPEIGLLILADGMGGYNAGEIASNIATTTILNVVRRGWVKSGQVSAEASTRPGAEARLLKKAIETAHREIRSKADSRSDYAGMGTTVVACLIHDDRLSVAHVGDSRLYRYRAGQLVQLTQDHSLLEEMISRGVYSREDASRLVRKNIVTRALGVDHDVLVDVVEDTLQLGDVLLLCSDGLSDMVSDEGIRFILDRHHDNVSLASKALVDIALAEGGRDNISVAVARIDGTLTPQPKQWHERLKKWF